MEGMIARLRGEARKIAESVGGESIALKGSKWCISLELSVAGDTGAPFWIQLHAGQINFRYLDAEEPGVILPEDGVEVPSGAKLVGWEKDLFCTYDLQEVSSLEAEGLVDSIIQNYFGLGGDFEFDVKLEALG